MYQVITIWNLSKPNEEITDSIQNIRLRGYNHQTFLPSQYAFKLKKKEVKSLSVSNIADRYCPSRRDLYIEKGINKPRTKKRKTWGRIAGTIADRYISSLLTEIRCEEEKNTYSDIKNKISKFHNDFLNENCKIISKLKSSEKYSFGVEAGDTEWFLKLLSYNGRVELSMKLIHSILRIKDDLNIDHLQVNRIQIRPKTMQIGISSPVSPDFIIPDFGIVGDIKTGKRFREHFLLTCAGYALAYENEKGEGNDINWGIIYFFPSYAKSKYVKFITFAQIYIFPIDDHLRRWFIDARDEAYKIISRETIPDFPPETERENCKYCKYLHYCQQQGLEVK